MEYGLCKALRLEKMNFLKRNCYLFVLLYSTLSLTADSETDNVPLAMLSSLAVGRNVTLDGEERL